MLSRARQGELYEDARADRMPPAWDRRVVHTCDKSHHIWEQLTPRPDERAALRRYGVRHMAACGECQLIRIDCERALNMLARRRYAGPDEWWKWLDAAIIRTAMVQEGKAQ